jgi:hypothetical protein
LLALLLPATQQEGGGSRHYFEVAWTISDTCPLLAWRDIPYVALAVSLIAGRCLAPGEVGRSLTYLVLIVELGVRAVCEATLN